MAPSEPSKHPSSDIIGGPGSVPKSSSAARLVTLFQGREGHGARVSRLVCSTCSRSVVRSQSGLTRALRPLTWLRNSLKATTRTDPRAMSGRVTAGCASPLDPVQPTCARPVDPGGDYSCLGAAHSNGCEHLGIPARGLAQSARIPYGHEPFFPTSSLPSRTFMEFPLAMLPCVCEHGVDVAGDEPQAPVRVRAPQPGHPVLVQEQVDCYQLGVSAQLRLDTPHFKVRVGRVLPWEGLELGPPAGALLPAHRLSSNCLGSCRQKRCPSYATTPGCPESHA
jgi:hypothetical protein